jgi:hypothetical protein
MCVSCMYSQAGPSRSPPGRAQGKAAGQKRKRKEEKDEGKRAREADEVRGGLGSNARARANHCKLGMMHVDVLPVCVFS